MNTRKWSAVVGGALFLGAFGLAQGIGATAATAAPAGITSATWTNPPPGPVNNYELGVKAGISAANKEAKANCEAAWAELDNLPSVSNNYRSYSGAAEDSAASSFQPSAETRQAQEDFNAGWDSVYDRAYNNAYRQYCN
ncbi:hypothetical protein [Actinoplanes couchii]|uniref:Secreted protein n=1 Tax=Actinoplanes couchii TaxID=403638 RepID=A0ABQ3XGA2_9ACTN|nr:hypothetical protein [Actinoplanes couchii]MDR6320938.1 hypothetical protein [Actinoplanes couchii]GID57450.1 hypothetical protein Aco03nite_058540 [Actinoplanes couchii]